MPDQKPDKSEANIIVLTDPWVTSGKYRKGGQQWVTDDGLIK